MKRLFRLVVRLYPSWWRRRYATEFEALIDDMLQRGRASACQQGASARQRARPSARAFDDITFGWRELFDILQGAFTMQLRSLGTIPVACTLAGALTGGFLAMRIPTVYASSATIQVDVPEVTNGPSPRREEFRLSLENALGQAGTAATATAVTLHRDRARTTIRVTYADRDPMQAQRGAERLAAAVASGTSGLGDAAEVIARPTLPTSPVEPDYAHAIGGGGVAGLMTGLVFLLVWSRLQRAHARSI